MKPSTVLITILATLIFGIPLPSRSADPRTLQFEAFLVYYADRTVPTGRHAWPLVRIEQDTRYLTTTFDGGFGNVATKVTCTYRGRKDGKDVFLFRRELLAQDRTAGIRETEVNFDGESSQIVFENGPECIMIEPSKQITPANSALLRR